MSNIIVRENHFLTPQVGLEPTTYRLTADRSTTELLRIFNLDFIFSKKHYKYNLTLFFLLIVLIDFLIIV